MKLFSIVLCTAVMIFLIQGCDSEKDTKWHWKQIDQYNEYIHNPDNLKQDQHGTYLDNVPDIMPSLHALEKAGEITHLDLVFPNVPESKEVTKLWMIYCDKEPGILYATGNPSYTEYKTSGTQPVHINIWFKTSVKDKVKQLIKDIGNFTKNK